MDGAEGMPDMQKLLSQMMGGLGEGGGQNLLGDVDDPAGLGGLPPNFGNMGGLGGMGAGSAFPGMPMGMGMGMDMGSQARSTVDRYFGLIHALGIMGLAMFIIGWWEPRLSATRWSGEILGSWASRWSGLVGKKGFLRGLKAELIGGVESLVSRLMITG
jgi:hypothetical protein